MNKVVVYDEETYPNIFTCAIVVANNPSKLRVYEISDRKNETEELLECLRNLRKGWKMVGFNNLGFDYPILHEIMLRAAKAKKVNKPFKITAGQIYKLAQAQIEATRDGGFAKIVKDEEIKQIDLFKIWHFDNKSKATSLKMLEVNMRSESVEDLPFPVGKTLTEDEMDILIKYNKHDILQTLKFLNYSQEALQLREELTEKFGFDCTNFNDTKIGKELFIRTLEKEQPGICYEQTSRGRNIRQTRRDKIVIRNCLFDYIKFDRPEFKALHEWFKEQVITETKGVFTDLYEHQLGEVAQYAEMLTKKKKISNPQDKKDKRYVPTEEHIALYRKEQPLGWIEEKELNSPKGAKSYYWCYRIAETLNVVIDGFRYDYGVGGIHGAKPGITRTENGKVCRTLDVTSFYPNMAIRQKIYPAHLGLTFCKVYEDLYDERSKHKKGTAANAALKLALNGSYGESNNEFSPLYDPAFTMAITCGGQLTLCMLMEQLINHCKAEIVMCNTDGFEYVIDELMVSKADELVKEWEKITSLEMEGDTYEVMYINNVNNYISITTSGKVKTKGAYEIPEYKKEGYTEILFDKHGWHKNHSAFIIPFAAVECLIKGVPVEDTIMKWDNPYDFLLRTKVPRSSRLVLCYDDGNEELQQNICRYYPSLEGGRLIKIMPPLEEGGEERRLGIDVEWNVKTCNHIKDFKWNLNYDYYITESQKLVDAIVKVDVQ